MAWFAYHYCEVRIASVPVRLTIAALVVLMPALGFENTADITDVIWMFLLALPWAIHALAGACTEGGLSTAITVSDYIVDALIEVEVEVGDPQVRKLASTHAGVHEESQDGRVSPTYEIVARRRGEKLFSLAGVEDGHRHFWNRRWLHVRHGMGRDYSLL